jgi:heme oxygenase
VDGPVARLLKERTAPVHERVEAIVGFRDDLSADRVRTVLCRFAGFWQAHERLIDEWAGHETDSALALQWSRRRRGEALRQDLLGFGLSVADLADLPEAPAIFVDLDTADVLGWLYVSEGSTLGGAVIDRAMRAQSGGASPQVRTFTPYLEGPGPMWREYQAQLGAWVGGDDDRARRVLDAADGTFRALEAWLLPIAVEDAA